MQRWCPWFDFCLLWNALCATSESKNHVISYAPRGEKGKWLNVNLLYWLTTKLSSIIQSAVISLWVVLRMLLYFTNLIVSCSLMSSLVTLVRPISCSYRQKLNPYSFGTFTCIRTHTSYIHTLKTPIFVPTQLLKWPLLCAIQGNMEIVENLFEERVPGCSSWRNEVFLRRLFTWYWNTT